jgi:hypothetical protein
MFHVRAPLSWYLPTICGLTGDIALESKLLALPEHILVARFFPAEKKKGAGGNWASDNFYHALHGNVSTYQLNTEHILHHATVSHDFRGHHWHYCCGPKNVPEKTMPSYDSFAKFCLALSCRFFISE